MNIKNTPLGIDVEIKAKKIPYYLLVAILTIGASLILGFLSFGGMYALLPALPLAFGAFALSVAYEGEIYLQNIKGAFNKLLKFNYLKNSMAKEYLLSHFPENTHDKDCPQFFKDYKTQLKLLSTFGHKNLDKASKRKKKKIEKTLGDMEKWFALQLFPAKNKKSTDNSEYAKELQFWLAQREQTEWQEQLESRRIKYHIAKGFSILASLFMGLGSTYLMVEAFSVIPFFAAIPFGLWPLMIVPMAIIAGAAYGMLTYNAVTDMINNNTVVKWYNKIRNDLSQGLTVRNVFIASTAVFLVGLAIALTVCTAGTWWTIATNARPLFEWMSKIPSFVMGVINPLITGASAIFFNIQNTAESLEMVDEATRSKTNIFQSIYENITKAYNHLVTTENGLQIINPFRILLKLTVTPLRVLLFLGHLLSIAVTADRMPGLPQVVAALIAIISEGFEDAHYFIGHSHDDEHEHTEEQNEHPSHKHHHDFNTLLKERLDEASGHDHSADIPTVIIKTIAAPIYALAALWDSATSRLNKSVNTEKGAAADKNPRVLSFEEAWNKQRGIAEEEHVELASDAKRPSNQWQKQHVISLIEKHEQKHLQNAFFSKEIADDKIRQLHSLKDKIQATDKSETLKEVLQAEKHQSVYNKHRLFAQTEDLTNTRIFIENLPERVNAL